MMQEHHLTLAMRQLDNTFKAHLREGETPTLPFLNFKYDIIRINVVRLSENQSIPLHRQNKRSPLMVDRLMALNSIQTRWSLKKLQCNRGG
jgi:hypothetical protein